MSGIPLNSPVQEGDLIAGKYRLGGVIASGGMGVIVAAKHETLDQRVAIKFLRPEAAESPEAKERFVREARAAARIESEHVVRVFDVGMHDGILPYMVMEYLEGADLSHEMRVRGALPVQEAVDRVLQALEAVAEAHHRGIVHRDLKPSNLFLVSRSGKAKRIRVKVLDFGISKVSAEVRLNASLTTTRSLLGSPGYMSPEQVRNTKGVDARTDIWSMGVILYELITGREAYVGESLGDVFAKIREEPLRPLNQVRPEVPEGLASVIAKCLERDRERRFADGAALHEALLPYGSEPTRGTLESLPDDRAPATSSPTLISREKPTVGLEADTRLEATTIAGTSVKTPATALGGTRPMFKRGLAVGGGLLGAIALGAVVWGLRSDAPEVHSTVAPASSPPVAAAPVEPVPPAVTAPAPSVSAAPAMSSAAAAAPVTSTSTALHPPAGTKNPRAAPPQPKPIASPVAPTPPRKKSDDLGI